MVNGVRHGDGHTRIHPGVAKAWGQAQRGGAVPMIGQRGKRRLAGQRERQWVLVSISGADPLIHRVCFGYGLVTDRVEHRWGVRAGVRPPEDRPVPVRLACDEDLAVGLNRRRPRSSRRFAGQPRLPCRPHPGSSRVPHRTLLQNLPATLPNRLPCWPIVKRNVNRQRKVNRPSCLRV